MVLEDDSNLKLELGILEQIYLFVQSFQLIIMFIHTFNKRLVTQTDMLSSLAQKEIKDIYAVLTAQAKTVLHTQRPREN